MRSGLALVLVASCSALPARGADEPCKPVKPCEVPEGAAAAVPEAPAELAAEVRQLLALVACRGPAPAGLDVRAVKDHCARGARRDDRARATRAAVEAALPDPRPEKVPPAVVSPLSGGDLVAARAAFPRARSYTLLGRSPAGEATVERLRDPAALRAFLDDVSTATEPRAALPALLGALVAEGAEPVGLRYFRVEPGGSLRFHGPSALRGLGATAWANCELLFVEQGAPERRLVVRYLQADLTDRGVEAAPGPLAHLASKGTFAALLPAGGAAAGPGYGRLRALLQQRAPVVVTPKR